MDISGRINIKTKKEYMNSLSFRVHEVENPEKFKHNVYAITNLGKLDDYDCGIYKILIDADLREITVFYREPADEEGKENKEGTLDFLISWHGHDLRVIGRNMAEAVLIGLHMTTFQLEALTLMAINLEAFYNGGFAIYSEETILKIAPKKKKEACEEVEKEEKEEKTTAKRERLSRSETN